MASAGYTVARETNSSYVLRHYVTQDYIRHSQIWKLHSPKLVSRLVLDKMQFCDPRAIYNLHKKDV